MEPDQNQPLVDELNRQLEALVKQAGLTSERILSFAKVRISANERLIFLASGVLTLTFSGIVSLYGRNNLHFTSEMLRPLLAAWRLLIGTIICCIIANSREGRAASIHDTDLQAHELYSRRVLLHMVAKKINQSAELPAAVAPKSDKSGSLHEGIAALFGWIARVMTVLAFVFMYIFVHSLVQLL